MCKKVEDAANILIDHLKKSPVLNQTIELVDSTIDELNKNFKLKEVSLDELVQKLSPDTDRRILEIQEQENLKFIGGELLVSISEKNKKILSLNMKLFFQNNVKKLILKDIKKELDIDFLDDKSKNELENKKEIKYEIDEPVV